MAEITSAGFIGKTENEYFTEETDLYLAIDPDWLLDPSTPDGLKIASDSEIFANLDEQAQLAYNSKDPNKATGIDLDIVCSLTGTTRRSATFSQVVLNLTGTLGTLVLSGKKVKSTTTGEEWQLDANVTLTGGVDVVNASAVNSGNVTADPATITTIVDSVSGWDTVTNPLAQFVTGQVQQTDASLRLERNQSVAGPGSNQLDSMLGAILETENVTQAIIFENFTGSVDGNGIPAHSIAALVEGGADSDVALSIYRKKNPGVGLFGAGTPVVVTVSSEVPNSTSTTDITFGRPTLIPIFLDLDVQDDGSLPLSTIVQDLKDSIIAYALGGEIAEECGFNNVGFGIGEDVTFSRMFTPVNQVIGSFGASFVITLFIDITPTPVATANIPIAFDEISQWLDANITITITPPP